ncbi:MAG: threonine-phosphate decarboxylase CobD [Janthinobacterium lividum]
MSGEAHGGRRLAAERRFPGAPRPLLDLSTGINPVPYPMQAPAAELWARLPDPEAVAGLEAAAAAAFGVGDASLVVAAGGTQAIIGVLPFLLPAGEVRVVSPTYAEHRRSWAAAGRAVEEVASAGALAGAAVGVLCNPNNPDGRRLAEGEVLALADSMAARGGMLVVDEAFADLDAASGTGAHPAVVRLRSFGKFFGLAGLRLGFAVAPAGVAARLREVLGPWAVSGPAAAAGTAALGDAAWIGDTRRRLAADAARLDGVLRRAGLRAAGAGGTALFRLVHEPAGLWERLGERGVLARRFERQGWLRFGLPGAEGEWARLEAALSGEAAPGAGELAAAGAGGAPGFDAAFRAGLDALFRWRRDVRRFRRDALAPGTLERLVATACLAPSVGLCQPWRFAAVDDPARRARVREVFRASNERALACYEGERAEHYARLKLSGLEDAPVQFAVFADRGTETGHGLGRASMPEMAEYSVVTAVHTMWLAARAEGLGLGWVSILDPAEVAAALDLPAAWRMIGYFCLGYPEAESERPELERLGWEGRRPASEFMLQR